MIRIWLVRLRMRPAEPRLRGQKRRMVGPSPMVASFTTRLARLTPPCSEFSALAMADFSVASTSLAALRGQQERFNQVIEPSQIGDVAQKVCEA